MHKGNIIDNLMNSYDPGHPLSAFTTELTDTLIIMLKVLNLKSLQEFQEFAEGTVLVAHNATFDVGFMNASYERHQLPTISQLVIDTLEFARSLYPEYKRHGLGAFDEAVWCGFDHHHMATMMRLTGRLLFIFIACV